MTIDRKERAREEFSRRAQEYERFHAGCAESLIDAGLIEVAERVLREQQADDVEAACLSVIKRQGSIGGGLLRAVAKTPEDATCEDEDA